MQTETRTRTDTFFLIVCWGYLIISVAMIGLALYGLTGDNVKLTLGGVTDAVFAIIGGVLGAGAGLLGLISRNIKRCRLAGLALLAIAAVPLAINLLAGQTFSVYWKNIAIMIVPAVYLIAALLKRGPKQKKPEQPQA
jgi:peptidoglycan/LPS O-acetylase OafA/YrhL